jgi:transposase
MINYIGIDVSSDLLHIAYETNSVWQTERIANQVADIHKWSLSLSENAHIIFEYTGTYSHRLAYILALAQKPFSIITPAQSKGFAASLKNKAKTDSQDAKMLAIYGTKMMPEASPITDQKLHQKRQVYKHYNDLRSQRQALNNQLHALSFDPRAAQNVVDSLVLLKQTFQCQIDEFEKQLFDLNEDDFKAIKDKLMQIKGIGEKVATGLIIETNGFKNFQSPKAVAAFLGLCPSNKQSGTSVYAKGRLVATACHHLRTNLYAAAWSASRFNLDCKELYTRLRAKGKSAKLAMIAVAHKLIRQAFAIVKKGTQFDNNFQLAK